MTSERKSLIPEFIRFKDKEIGFKIGGVLEQLTFAESRDGGSYPVVTMNDNGQRFKFNAPAQVAEALAFVKIGTRLEIVYTGKEKSSHGGDMFIFEVYQVGAEPVDLDTGELIE